MKGLMRTAASLPRFTMDCGFWRTRRYVGASPAVVGLQVAAISYCYEHGTDGWIPNDGLAGALGFKEKEVSKLVPELLRRDVWQAAEDGGFRIVGYLDHNPSRAEVSQQRALRAEASAKANHKRWHRDRSDPECVWCSDSDSDSESTTDSDVESKADSQEKRREEKRRGTDGDPPTDPPDFAAFWLAYPNGAGKGAARKAWPKALKAAGGDPEVIIHGAERFAADPNREDAYTPHASSWLNAERWLDPPLPARLDRNGRVKVPMNPDLPEWMR